MEIKRLCFIIHIQAHCINMCKISIQCFCFFYLTALAVKKKNQRKQDLLLSHVRYNTVVIKLQLDNRHRGVWSFDWTHIFWQMFVSLQTICNVNNKFSWFSYILVYFLKTLNIKIRNDFYLAPILAENSIQFEPTIQKIKLFCYFFFFVLLFFFFCYFFFAIFLVVSLTFLWPFLLHLTIQCVCVRL